MYKNHIIDMKQIERNKIMFIFNSYIRANSSRISTVRMEQSDRKSTANLRDTRNTTILKWKRKTKTRREFNKVGSVENLIKFKTESAVFQKTKKEAKETVRGYPRIRVHRMWSIK